MKTLKTIVATAVIALSATTVATAGVHAVTQNNNAQANPIASHQAKQAQKYYAVGMSAKDLQRLVRIMNGQKATAQHKAAGMRTGFAARSTSGRSQTGHSYQRTTNRGSYNGTYRCPWYGTHSATHSGYSGSTWHSGGGNGSCW